MRGTVLLPAVYGPCTDGRQLIVRGDVEGSCDLLPLISPAPRSNVAGIRSIRFKTLQVMNTSLQFASPAVVRDGTLRHGWPSGNYETVSCHGPGSILVLKYGYSGISLPRGEKPKSVNRTTKTKRTLVLPDVGLNTGHAAATACSRYTPDDQDRQWLH